MQNKNIYLTKVHKLCITPLKINLNLKKTQNVQNTTKIIKI